MLSYQRRTWSIYNLVAFVNDDAVPMEVVQNNSFNATRIFVFHFLMDELVTFVNLNNNESYIELWRPIFSKFEVVVVLQQVMRDNNDV